MAPRLVSQAEFARLAGVSAMAVSKAVRGKLSDAKIGRRLNLDHESVVAYLASKGKTVPAAPAASPKKGTRKKKAGGKAAASSKPAAKPRTRKRLPTTTQLQSMNTPAAMAAIGELTINEAIERYGTVTHLRDWLLALKEMEAIREKRLKNEESEGKLIPREPVRAYVFGAIDAANRRLLNDSSKTIALRLYALAEAGTPLEDAERIVRELISSQLRPVKQQAAKGLRIGEKQGGGSGRSERAQR